MENSPYQFIQSVTFFLHELDEDKNALPLLYLLVCEFGIGDIGNFFPSIHFLVFSFGVLRKQLSADNDNSLTISVIISKACA